MKRDAIDLGKVHIPTLFRIYLVPTLLGMLSLCAVTATDGIFVGRGCGSDALAAVNISHNGHDGYRTDAWSRGIGGVVGPSRK